MSDQDNPDHSFPPSGGAPLSYQSNPYGSSGHNYPSVVASELPYSSILLLTYPSGHAASTLYPSYGSCYGCSIGFYHLSQCGPLPAFEEQDQSRLPSTEGRVENSEVLYAQSCVLRTSQFAPVDERTTYSSTNFWPTQSFHNLAENLGYPGTGDYPRVSMEGHRSIESTPYLPESPVDYHRHIGNSPMYTSVKALFLHWKNDGDLLGCTDEVRQLEKMFCQCFGFQTEIFSISENHTDNDIIECISRFFKGARADDLLIVYYAGHAFSNPFRLVRYICPTIQP
jgi:hypothetical protein